MKKAIYLAIFFQGMYFTIFSQNILLNPGFEGDSATYSPFSGDVLFDKAPNNWEDFISVSFEENEKWFTDIVNTNPNIGVVFENAFYRLGCISDGPWINCGDSAVCPSQNAFRGRYFIGINHNSSLSRCGIQQHLSGSCPLNSGKYELRLRYAKYTDCAKGKLFFHLSRKKNRRHFKIGSMVSKSYSETPGDWKLWKFDFELKLGKKGHSSLDWFTITSSNGIFGDNYSRFMFVDALRLTRPCDTEFVCYASQGQICPQIGLNVPQSNPLIIKNLENATDINIEVTSASGATITDFQAHNENGLPDIYWPDSSTLSSIAGGIYGLKITIKNECGGIVENRTILINQPSYPLAIDFVDSTANWSKVPEPCCLQDLVLENETLIGNLNYIVKGKIIIGDSVSILPGSNVYFQAEEVVNIQNLDSPFGANLLIDLVPCN